MSSARLASACSIAAAVGAALAGCGAYPSGPAGPVVPTEPTPGGGDGWTSEPPPEEEDGTDCGCDAPATDASDESGASDSTSGGSDTDSGGASGGEGELRRAPAVGALRAAAAVPTPPGCVHGVVVDAQGRPVAGAYVVIAQGAGTASGTTGRAGHFCLRWDTARTALVAVVALDGARAWSVVDATSPPTLDTRGCAALRPVIAAP